MKRIYLALTLTAVILTACGPSSQEVANWTAVAGTAEVRLTASAGKKEATATLQPIIVNTPTPFPTNTLIPIDTPLTSPTPAITITSSSSIQGNPQDFCLTSTDLPNGFVPDYSGSSTNEQVALARENPEEFLGLLEKWGRVDGYSTAYSADTSNTGFYIQSSVVIMETPNGAHDYFQYLKNEREQEVGLNVSVPLIGEESYARLTKKLEDQVFELSFRKQNVLVTLHIIKRGQDPSEDALKYAYLLESRLSTDPNSAQVPNLVPTPTPLLGIGNSVRCGDLWEISATHAPELGSVLTQEPPKGEYAKVYFMLKNLQDQPGQLNKYNTALTLVGDLEGRSLSFEPTFLTTNLIEKDQGIVNWFDDIPPLVQVSAQAVFDVNPAATNWRLQLTDKTCTTEIALYDVE